MKAVMPVLFLLLMLPFASGLGIKGTYDSFYNDESPEIVIADQQNADDQLAAFGFVNEFGLKNITLKSKIKNTPLVIIGGPCANPLWTEFAGDTCEGWTYGENKAVIVTHQLATGKIVLLIGGTTGKDTRAAAKYVSENFNTLTDEKKILDTTGLPLANDKLKVYKTESNLGKDESAAAGNVVILIPDDASGGDEDLADGLMKHLKKSYPLATVNVYTSSEVDTSFIQGKILIMMRSKPLISVDDDAPAAHVVIATAAAFWVTAQGFEYEWTTHNSLVNDDLEF